MYDLDLDTEPLESFASDVERYDRDLAEHVEATREEQRPDDRMYV